MSGYPETDFFSFSYEDGSPASFAQVEVFAEVTAGSGRKILVWGGNGTTTNGEGMLLERIQRLPNWNQPELHLRDEVDGRTAKFELYRAHYTLDWERPVPFGEFDGVSFSKPGDFLDYLAVRYKFLSNMRPSPLDFKLIRVGSPAEFAPAANLFTRLRTEMMKARQYAAVLDPGDSADLVARVDEEMMKPARYLMWAISDLIRINARTFGKHTRATLALAYLEMLQRIAKDRSTLSLPKIMTALQRVLPFSSRTSLVISTTEDWLLAALVIFLAGLIPYGYGFASFDEDRDANFNAYTISIKMAIAK